MDTAKTYLCIFIAPPGAGKGSLSQRCVSRYGWHQVSVGDLCRSHVKSKTQIGKKIDFFINSGKLVPDELIVDMVFDELSRLRNTDVPVVILDGFPRTQEQGSALCEFVRDQKNAFEPLYVQFDISDEAVMQRLEHRRVCTECGAVYSTCESSLKPPQEGTCGACGGELVQRKDDTHDVIAQRLRVYHEHAKPLLEFVQERNERCLILDATTSLDEMAQKLKTYIEHGDNRE